MTSTYKAYKYLINDIKENLISIKVQIDKKEIAKSLYGGFYVWDSKFILNPEIMFLGINPGNGNPNNSRQIITKAENQISYLEYLYNENPKYKLAIETVKSFELAGFSSYEIIQLFENNSIKTNFHYIITNNQKDIRKCFNELDNYTFNEFWLKSYNWTGQLIELIKPKVIICEGKTVFDSIKDLDEIVELNWKNDCGYLLRPNGQLVIGYSRRYSNIKNKEELSILFKNYIKK